MEVQTPWGTTVTLSREREGGGEGGEGMGRQGREGRGKFPVGVVTVVRLVCRVA